MNKDDLLFIIVEIIMVLIAIPIQIWILSLVNLANMLMFSTVFIIEVVIVIIFFILALLGTEKTMDSST